jgi:hypothetical protein
MARSKEPKPASYAELKQVGVYREAYLKLHARYAIWNRWRGVAVNPPLPEAAEDGN